MLWLNYLCSKGRARAHDILSRAGVATRQLLCLPVRVLERHPSPSLPARASPNKPNKYCDMASNILCKNKDKRKRANKPRHLKQCLDKHHSAHVPTASVELLGSPCYKGVPLPRISSVRKLGMKSCIAQRSEHASVGPQGMYSHAGQPITEPLRQYSRSVGTAQYASTIGIPRSRAVLDPAWHTNRVSRRSNARRVTLQLRAPVKQ